MGGVSFSSGFGDKAIGEEEGRTCAPFFTVLLCSNIANNSSNTNSSFGWKAPFSISRNTIDLIAVQGICSNAAVILSLVKSRRRSRWFTRSRNTSDFTRTLSRNSSFTASTTRASTLRLRRRSSKKFSLHFVYSRTTLLILRRSSYPNTSAIA